MTSAAEESSVKYAKLKALLAYRGSIILVPVVDQDSALKS